MCPWYLFIFENYTINLIKTWLEYWAQLETSELIVAAYGGGRGSQHHHHRPSLLIDRAAADAEIKPIFSGFNKKK